MTTMLYQGHGSFRLTANDGTTIYVDPYAGEGYQDPADIIIVTHEHGDHTSVDKMPHNPGCVILRAADFQPLAGDYRAHSIKGISFTPVQACNKNHPVDECVGVVAELDDLKFYIAGDTSTTQDMESGKLAAMNLDYATLPGDGYFNMGPEEASACALLIGAKHYFPVHLVPVHSYDVCQPFSRQVAEAFTAPGRIIVEPGQTVEL